MMSLVPTEIAGRRVMSQGIFIALTGEEIKITPFAEQPDFFVYIRHLNAEDSSVPVTFRRSSSDFSYVEAISYFRSGVMRSTKEPVIIAEDENHRYELRLNYTLVGEAHDYAVNGSWIVLSGDKS